jgi:RNA polymerase sigma-70 factor (ECF subfamily)
VDDARERDGLYSTTQWSLVVAAGDSQNPDAREALESLCRVYWYPVYAQIRKRGQDPEAAKDLTQGFFAELLEKRSLRLADPNRGRFRSFLKSSVDHFLSHERHRAAALKRGGARSIVSLDFDGAEAQYRLEPVRDQKPDKLFERRWARAMLSCVLERLGEEARAAGDAYRFQRLASFLTGRTPGLGYREVAAELEMTEAAVKVAVHRMRHRYGELLRAEVARTVNDAAGVDAEIRYLFLALDR